MIAMMLPSVAPINILYSTLIRQSNREQNPAILAATFLVGYLAAWVFFSLIATVLQSLLELRGFVSPMQISLTSQIVSAGILICAGLYQLPQWRNYVCSIAEIPRNILQKSGDLAPKVLSEWGWSMALFVSGTAGLLWRYCLWGES